MKGSIRNILEVIADPGTNPTLQVDTDELSPVSYSDLTVRSEQFRTIAPSATDQAIAIPDCCLLLILSDEPFLLKLDAGETELRGRSFQIGAEDSDHIAISARDILVSGNGASTANIAVYCLGTVP